MKGNERQYSCSKYKCSEIKQLSREANLKDQGVTKCDKEVDRKKYAGKEPGEGDKEDG